ncbi:MAG: tRNA-intron lyase [Candidatus Korarchaeota archaeon]|nr:tRNA-intron lyase [Candidatus Korarchaeota archaeon]NIU83258.1 tRNA-intron lyase [Candidatus Thorarchaeota archaeon]NIW13602.1 tRNA-intron lyase [Candidatus Thorarchaeota archaeon]NIW51698.1 tRNA-intron lyase [Candidatus Korarchaeota archaeon]
MQETPQWKTLIEEYESEEIKAELIEGQGIIYDHEKGSFLFENGFFGKPLGVKKPKPDFYEKMFTLSLFEALYLYDKGLLILTKGGKALKRNQIEQIGKKQCNDFYSKFLVYRDLREKGWIVRPGLKFGADFSIYRYGPHLEHAPLLINVFSQDKELLGIDFVRSGRLATSVKKKWALALVLDESVEYLTFKWYRP